MSKKQNKPIKTCADCIHEFACRGWTGGRKIADTSASQCPNHQTVKESGAYLCGVLDERKRKKTNADRIRAMTDAQLVQMLTIGRGGFSCLKCAESEDCGQNCEVQCLKWLQQPAEDANNETVGERKYGDGNG